MLEIQGLNQFYGESHTLWDINLQVEAGTSVCILGRNGVGKTTLFKTIMGLLPAQSQALRFDGHDLQGRAAAWRAQFGLGYVPQGREIFPRLTVAENLQIGLYAKNAPTDAVPPRIYDWFPALRHMAQRQGGDLSGGLQQQLALGRALAIQPKMLLLDEPTEGIQPDIVQEIGDLLIQLKREEKMTILLAETKVKFARRVADVFYILDRGRIVANGAMSELTDELINRHLTV